MVASNISHLNIGNQMDMDQVTVINIAILALFIITKMNKYIGDDSGPPQPSPCELLAVNARLLELRQIKLQASSPSNNGSPWWRALGPSLKGEPMVESFRPILA